MRRAFTIKPRPVWVASLCAIALGMPLPAQGQTFVNDLVAGDGIRFTEFLRNVPGGDGVGEFFEFQIDAGTTVDFETLALIEIDGDGGAAGTLDFVVDFIGGGTFMPAADTLVFGADDTQFNADGSTTIISPPILPLPASAPATISPGSALDFGFENGTATFAIVGGFDFDAPGVFDDVTGEPIFDFDADNDGAIDPTLALPFTTVFDAVTLTDGDVLQVNGGFDSAFADDLPNGTVFDAAGAEPAFGSGDGPDGFLRLIDPSNPIDPTTPTVLAVFDADDFDDEDADTIGDTVSSVNVLGFDPATPAGFPDIAEIAILDDTLDEGETELDGIRLAGIAAGPAAAAGTEPVPGTDPTLTPGSPNTLELPAVEDQGEEFDPPPPPGVPDNIVFTDAEIAATLEGLGSVTIASTSFENETPTVITVTEGDTFVEGVDVPEDFNGNGVTGESIVIDDIDGDDTPGETFTLAYVEGATRSEPTLSGAPAPIIDPVTGEPSAEDSASGVVVDLFNSAVSPEPQNFAGPDGDFGTTDDVLFNTDAVVAILDSTSSSEAAGDLGFDSVFIDTREDGNETGSAAFDVADGGDFLGVTAVDVLGLDPDDTDGVQDGRDGLNVFQANDTDGTIQTTFDVVDLEGFTNVTFSFLLGVEETGYEPPDSLLVELDITTDTGSETLTVIDLSDDADLELLGDIIDGDVPDFGSEAGLGLVTFELPATALTAQAIFTFDTSSGAEEFIIDLVQFLGDPLDGGIAGDLDGDGDVDVVDLDLFADSLLSGGTDLSGDLDGDLDVDVVDLDLFADALLGTDPSPASLAALQSIPEPASAVLVLGGLAALGRRRRDTRAH